MDLNLSLQITLVIGVFGFIVLFCCFCTLLSYHLKNPWKNVMIGIRNYAFPEFSDDEIVSETDNEIWNNFLNNV